MAAVVPAVTVKQEQVDTSEVENKILALCQENPKGINDKQLQNDIPDIDAKTRVTVLNKLLSSGKLELLRNTDNTLMYRLKDQEAAKKVKGADNEDKIVYQIIKDAGNKGIWMKDIRFKSNLAQKQVDKIIKSLQGKKLIKAVKSVAASKKKIYMLYDIEPDRSVTGGAWYTQSDFESEFVDILTQQCYNFLKQKAANAREQSKDPIMQKNFMFAALEDIWTYITDSKISTVKLEKQDIASLLNTLIYDGKVEKTMIAAAGQSHGKGDGDLLTLYRAVEPLLPPTGLMRMPCGVCPLVNQCAEGGLISPSTCVYMKEWLEY